MQEDYDLYSVFILLEFELIVRKYNPRLDLIIIDCYINISMYLIEKDERTNYWKISVKRNQFLELISLRYRDT